MCKPIFHTHIVLIYYSYVFHQFDELLTIGVYISSEEIFHVIEELRQVFILFEHNQRVFFDSCGNEEKDDIVAIVVVEIVRNQLLAHEFFQKFIIEVIAIETIPHAGQ